MDLTKAPIVPKISMEKVKKTVDFIGRTRPKGYHEKRVFPNSPLTKGYLPALRHGTASARNAYSVHSIFCIHEYIRPR